MIIIVLIIIAVLSFVWALFSLRSLQKGVPTKETRKELNKERVIFHSSDLPPSL